MTTTDEPEALDGVVIRPERPPIWQRPSRFDRDGFCKVCQEYGPEYCTCKPPESEPPDPEDWREPTP